MRWYDTNSTPNRNDHGQRTYKKSGSHNAVSHGIAQPPHAMRDDRGKNCLE
jgi:hypothetical protein